MPDLVPGSLVLAVLPGTTSTSVALGKLVDESPQILFRERVQLLGAHNGDFANIFRIPHFCQVVINFARSKTRRVLISSALARPPVTDNLLELTLAQSISSTEVAALLRSRLLGVITISGLRVG